MRGPIGTLAAIAVWALAPGAVAGAAEAPTRDAYVARVDSICKRDREAGKRILAGARRRIGKGKLGPAGRQLIRASERFGLTIRQIVRVPRPPAEEAKLRKWFRFLRLVRKRVRRTGKHFTEGERLKATHESIRAEKSGNAANNVSFAYRFDYCRLTRSRFR